MAPAKGIFFQRKKWGGGNFTTNLLLSLSGCTAQAARTMATKGGLSDMDFFTPFHQGTKIRLQSKSLSRDCLTAENLMRLAPGRTGIPRHPQGLVQAN